MQVRTSKHILDRQKSGRLVLSVFALQGKTIAAAVDERLQSHLSARERVDYRAMFRGFEHAIEGVLAKLVAADEAHYRAKAEHKEWLRRRDRLCRPIVERLVGLRRAVRGLYRAPDLGRLGLAGETPRDAVALLRRLERVIEVLASDEHVEMLGEPIFDGQSLDPRGFVPRLERDAVELRELLEALQLARRRIEDALLRKRSLLGEYDQLFLRVARIFEDCCRLAGRYRLADRIRKSERRRHLPAGEPPAEPAPAPDTS